MGADKTMAESPFPACMLRKKVEYIVEQEIYSRDGDVCGVRAEHQSAERAG